MKTLIIIFTCFALGCAPPKLSLQRKDLEGSRLRTDGFFYEKKDYWSFVLFKNGVVYGGEGIGQKTTEAAVKRFSDSTIISRDKKLIYTWGLFEVINDSITIEMWESREWAKYAKRTYEGRIINDSTILLNQSSEGSTLFYLHHLDKKPDSTNKFTIKE